MIRSQNSHRQGRASRGAVPRLAVLAAVALTTLAGCSSDDQKADDAPTSAVDPAQEPSIEKSFVVDPDGRKDALICWGEGKPTVLLETGGNNIEEWTGSNFVTVLAPFTRVCTYDRAGTGASDPAPMRRRTADDVVREASNLLEAAGLEGPLVLLGRSFGGMVAAHYAETMPDDVVGVVILDTPAPSAEFTEESEPELVWDNPGNTEHLDVVGGFENRFARNPPHFDVPLLLITPLGGEGSAENEGFWLQSSPESRQVELSCGDDATAGPCAAELVAFVKKLDAD